MSSRNPRWCHWWDGEEPIVPEPASSPPFTYGLEPENCYQSRESEDVLKMDGIAQATPEELRRLFSGREERKQHTKQWLATQLHLFGVPFKKSARRSDLKDALEKAWKAGKCEELAPSVAAVRDRLRKEYDDEFHRLEDRLFAEIEGGHQEEANADPPRFVAKHFLDSQGRPDGEKTKEPLSFLSWNEDELEEVVNAVPGLAILKTGNPRRVLVGWDTTMEKGIENEFTRLESEFHKKPDIQSRQANVDLKLFLSKYLSLDVNGKPLATNAQPSAPVTLDRFWLHNRQLPEEIASIASESNLHMKEFDSIAVIGWDASAVDAEIARLEDAARREKEQMETEERAREEKKAAEKKARWERRRKGYFELVAKQQQRPSPLGLQHLPGLYLVQWHDQKDYDHCNDPYYDSDLMKINVFPSKSSHGVTAVFNFGIIEGTMLLGMSPRAVELLRDEQPKHSEYSEPEESGDDDDDSSWAAGFSWTGRNKDAKVKLAGEKRSLGEIADPYGVLAARAKRQKADAPKQGDSHPNRVYFQFACNEVNAYPLEDDKNEHIGYLDFDQTGLAAKGVFYLPEYFSQKAQSISIFKIADKPESGAETDMKRWCMFDGRHWGPRWGSGWW